MKVVPIDAPTLYPPSTGILLTRDEKNRLRKIVWRRKFINLPPQALISPDGRYVITLNNWGQAGYSHSLVLYGPTGQLIHDFHLEDLLTQDEIYGKVTFTESSRHWNWRVTFTFSTDNQDCTIRWPWGKAIRLQLATGKISPVVSQR